MSLKEKTLQICKENNIKPARSRGQNFLIAEKVYDDIVNFANLNKDDIVLEVGPGLGFLTEKLAKKAKRVIAVELDAKIAKYLKKKFREKQIKNITVANSDILNFVSKEKLMVGDVNFENFNYKVVANLPYTISSIFLRKFLSLQNKPSLMVLMLQKEVAENIVAPRGKKSKLSVLCQFYAKAEIMQKVNAENFYPKPKVNSAIIKIKPHKKTPNIDEEKFFRLIRHGFSSKRKMLKNNLSAGLRISIGEAENLLKQAGFNPKTRAQELGIKDWANLLDFISF